MGREEALSTASDALARFGAVLVVGRRGAGRTRFAREIADSHDPTVFVCGRPHLTEVELGVFGDLVPDEAQPARRIASVAAELSSHALVVVDDAHWLDNASLAVVKRAVDTRGLRVLLTATPPRRSDLGLIANRDDVVEIALGPVQPEATRSLLAHHDLAPDAAREVEVAAHGQAGLIVRMATEGVDAVLAEIVENELTDLDADERTAVELAAVADPVPLEVLEHHVDQMVVTRLERRGVLTATRSDRRITLALTDPVHGSALRAVVGEAAARVYRRALLAHLDANDASRDDDAAQIVELRVDLGHEPDVADLVDAARQRYADAIGPDVATTQADAAAHTAALSRAHRLARMASDAGSFAATDLLVEIEGHRLELTSQIDALARLSELASTDEERRIAQTRLGVVDLLTDRDPTAALAEITEALAGDEEPDGRRILHALAAWAAILAGRVREAIDHGRTVIEDDACDGPIRLAAVPPLTLALAHYGRTRDALALVDRTMAVLDGTENPSDLSTIVGARIVALTIHGDLAETRDVATQMLAAAEAMNHPLGILGGRLTLAHMDLAGGRLDEARTAAQQVFEMSTPSLMGFRESLQVLARAAAYQGDAAAARTAMDRSEESTVAFQLEGIDGRRSAAWVLVAEGRHDDAIAAFRTAVTEAAEQRPPGVAVLLHDMIRLGCAGESAALSDVAAGCQDLMAPIYAAHGRALAARDGRALDDVSQRFEEAGWMLHAAEAAGQAAEQHSAAGHEASAAAAARRSIDLAERCGAARTPAIAPPPSLANLTRREREVARLAADGLADREIAEALHVSVRTVGSHLYRTYAKLGVANRDELSQVVRSASPG